MAKKKKKEKADKNVKKSVNDEKKNIEQDETIEDILQEAEEKIENTEDEEKEKEEDSVESLTQDLKEQQDKYIRLMAEFDNYKRRTSKEYERMVESANERLMGDIIEVRENFERALTMADEKHDFASFLEGMKLIFNKLDENLTKNGLSVFTEVGDDFDPELHDAMMKTPHADIPEDCIVQIFEKGYKLKKHVIKHAKVIVSSGEPQEVAEDNADEDTKTEE